MSGSDFNFGIECGEGCTIWVVKICGKLVGAGVEAVDFEVVAEAVGCWFDFEDADDE